MEGGAYLLKWSAVDLAKIDAPQRLEEQTYQLKMRLLIARRNDRSRAASFRPKLEQLKDLKTAAIRGGDHGEDDQDQRAIGIALQPSQLLLEYARPRAVDLLASVVEEDQEEGLRTATLRKKAAAARLATAAAEQAAMEAEMTKMKMIRKLKRVRRM